VFFLLGSVVDCIWELFFFLINLNLFSIPYVGFNEEKYLHLIILHSFRADDPDLCRNTMKYRNTHKHRDAAEIRLHFINNK
jgi:hypothetical protein